MFLKHFMKVLELIGMIVPENIFAHHSTLCHTRTNNGRCCNKHLVVVAFQTPQQTAHGRTFYIKTTDCFSLAQEFVCGFFILGNPSITDVDGYAAVFLDDFHSVIDCSQTALRKNVKFFKTNIFSHVHVELYDGKTLWWHLKRRIMRNGLLRNQDATGMHTSLVGKFFEKHSVFLDHFYHFIAVVQCHWVFGQNIELFFGESKCFPNFTKDRTILKLYIGSAKCHVVFSVFFEDIM